MRACYFNIHGVIIRLSSSCHSTFDNLTRDFYLYRTPQEKISSAPYLSINIREEKPPYEKIPPIEAHLHGIGSIAYKQKNITYVDYAGRGLMIFDFAKEEANIYGEDGNFLYETARLTLLSRLGELLDNKSIHRLHALGLSKNGTAVICLLPMEGGKTTTVLNVLRKDADVKLVSDDICFIDFHGCVYPFVTRIGARNVDLLQDIPREFITEINRTVYGKKYLIDPCFFESRVSKKSKITHILIGKRIFQNDTTISRISRIKCLIPFLTAGVFGLGIPQVLEFFMRGNLLFLLGKINLAFSRMFLFVSVICRAKTYEIKIGRDIAQSTEKISDFITTELS